MVGSVILLKCIVGSLVPTMSEKVCLLHGTLRLCKDFNSNGGGLPEALQWQRVKLSGMVSGFRHRYELFVEVHA